MHSSFPPNTAIVFLVAILHACQGIRMSAASITAGTLTCTDRKEFSTEQRVINLPMEHCAPQVCYTGGLHRKTFEERAAEE